jgi:hypothetical protein
MAGRTRPGFALRTLLADAGARDKKRAGLPCQRIVINQMGEQTLALVNEAELQAGTKCGFITI